MKPDANAHRAAGSPAGFLAWLPLLAGLGFLASCGDFVLFPEDEVSPVASFTIAPAESLACAEETVTVDASASEDPGAQEGEELQYAWTFASAPGGSQATFADDTAVSTTFSPDVTGTYQVKLTLTTSIRGATAEKTEAMTAEDTPIAVISYTPTSVKAGDEVTLSGNESMDPLEDCSSTGLSFSWELTSLPDGSQAALDDPASATPKFEADLVGSYQVQLTVTQKSTEAAATTTVTITAGAST